MVVASRITHAFLVNRGTCTPKLSYLKSPLPSRHANRLCAQMRNLESVGDKKNLNVLANMKGNGEFELGRDCVNDPDRVGVVGGRTELGTFDAGLQDFFMKGATLSRLILSMVLWADQADAVQLPCSSLIHLISPWTPKIEHHLMLADLEAGTAQLTVNVLSPVFAALNFLFIVRIVMSWYPQIPVRKFPFVIAYVPTELVLGPTRKLIPPVGGVDVSPVIWVALISFLNEVLLGSQGLLVLLSQQQQ